MKERRNDSRKRSQSRSFNNDGDGYNGGGFHSRPREQSYSVPREMHKAVCADCAKECEVPFKPKEDRPVYCRECFAKHRPPQRF